MGMGRNQRLHAHRRRLTPCQRRKNNIIASIAAPKPDLGMAGLFVDPTLGHRAGTLIAVQLPSSTRPVLLSILCPAAPLAVLMAF